MANLSVVISAYNEEKKIEDCLKSVSFADEIIFVDSSSTDQTVGISKKYASRIFTRPNNPMLNVNKNFGFSKAKNDWILSLDADERITSELANEIKEKIGNWKLEIGNSDVVGFWIPRKNIIFNKWIKHAGWYPDYQLRLFKKGKGRFIEEHVHEMIEVEGETERLANPIVHYNYDTIFQFLQKLTNVYGPNEAEQMLKKGYKFAWQDAIRMPLKEFLSRFFAREGYKDGFHGLMLSMLMAFYHFVVFALIWEKRGFEKIEDKNMLEKTELEFKRIHKDLLFWIRKEKIKQIKNPIKKSAYKLFNKLG